ncbi:MAG TPA: response regulator transcription factor [Candidatus Eremiobacteraceae bacterium]|nr:response regulator transcription factor [Candidatus Eremiobacteraceae bacterium]
MYSTFLIASPSAIVREGLKTLLLSDAGLYWVGDTVSEDELLARARDLRVDILLFDLDLLDETAGNALARVRAVAPDTRILALADTWSDQRIVPALRAGAHGFIIRRSTAGEISDAMPAAQSGSLVLNPAAAELLKQQLQTPETPLEHLSARELEVLRALARGLPNKLIAQELIISEHTVKFHIRSILDKLNAANRTEAVRNGLERGLISI